MVRRKHPALATERSYCAWLRRYCDSLKVLPAHLSSEQKLERLLNALAQENVAASTQNQAFNERAAGIEQETLASTYRRRINGSPDAISPTSESLGDGIPIDDIKPGGNVFRPAILVF